MGMKSNEWRLGHYSGETIMVSPVDGVPESNPSTIRMTHKESRGILRLSEGEAGDEELVNIL